ncbi:hypothetical protein D3C80_1546470 [compost metagenome]
MAEAARATAIMNISAGGWPRQSVPKANVAVQTARMVMASRRPNRSTLRSSGVARVWMSTSIWLILPSSVMAPVATTMPLAWP